MTTGSIVSAVVAIFVGFNLTRINGGVRVKETDRHYIDVLLQLYNWRVVTTEKETGELIYSRYWCYQGTGFETLERAVLSCLEWDGADDTEPRWWFKNGQTGEYRELSWWYSK